MASSSGIARSGRRRPRRRRASAIWWARMEPGELLGLGRPAELVPPLVGLEQGLLDDVGGVDLRPEPRPDLDPREQPEIVAQLLRRPEPDLVVAGHDVSPGRRRSSRPRRARGRGRMEPWPFVAGVGGDSTRPGAGPQTPSPPAGRSRRTSPPGRPMRRAPVRRAAEAKGRGQRRPVTRRAGISRGCGREGRPGGAAGTPFDKIDEKPGLRDETMIPSTHADGSTGGGARPSGKASSAQEPADDARRLRSPSWPCPPVPDERRGRSAF
jgi:hypothetical protein